ncbi:MAG: substrate-binding domain-containing protein [Oscillospiraceae bacterium]|nr:substrate-binding domain-containing protein [Oscillospiraceae bacterium]
MKKIVAILLALVLVIGLAACASQTEDAAQDDELIIAHLPKSIGGAWYTRMFAGFERFAADRPNVEVVQIGHTTGDATLQIQAIEDFIVEVQGRNAALCVSFVSPEPLEGVLQRAMEAGIIVLGDEGPFNTNLYYNVAPFIDAEYAANAAHELASMIGYEGQYAIFVNNLGAALHVLWADVIRETMETYYPNIELVTYPYMEGLHDPQNAYERTMELFRAFPDLRGIYGASSTCSAGIARAIAEAGRCDTFAFITNGVADLYVHFIHDGTVNAVTGWDPSMHGEAMATLAYRIFRGERAYDGMDLGVAGFDAVNVSGTQVTGNRWQWLTRDNIDEIIERYW